MFQVLYKTRSLFHAAWKLPASDDTKYGSTARDENNILAPETVGRFFLSHVRCIVDFR